MSINKQRFALVAALMGWCVSLVAIRFVRDESYLYIHLLWNLGLAFIPLVASTGFRLGHEHDKPWLRLAAFAVWLAFLPNAPYILTDFLHLATQTPPALADALWFDVSIMTSIAGTGLFFGYLSLLEVQTVVARWNTGLGWAVALCSQALCGFGIYVGRFLHFNSWDIVANPHALMSQILTSSTHTSAFSTACGVSIVYTVSLALGYVALHFVANAARAIPADV